MTFWRHFCVIACFTILSWRARAAVPSWPEFRGPNSSGVAGDAKAPLHIGPTNGVLWKTDVPWSPSSPCVWGNRIFLTTFVDGKLETRGYNRADGKLLWTGEVTAEKLEGYHKIDGSPAAATPATDGNVVVSYFGSFGVVAYDLEGRELWRHRMPV